MGKKERYVIFALMGIAVAAVVLIALFTNTFGTGNKTGTELTRWSVGDYYTYRFVARHYTEGGALVSTELSNYTITVTAVNGTTVTVAMVYDNGLRPNVTSSFDAGSNDILQLTNIQMVGAENIPTAFGRKVLSHYNRSEPWPAYDIWIDDSTMLTFKSVVNTGSEVMSVELIGTNVEWVTYLAKA